MARHLTGRTERSPDMPSGLHPLVYKVAIGLVALFVVSAWILFDRQNDVELPLAIVGLFLLVAVLLPYLLWRTWRSNQRRPPSLTSDRGFRQWADGSVEVWQSRLKGADAAIDMLLPLAAVALGLLALGIAFNLS